MKKVVVGSHNPVKLEATKRAFAAMFPEESFEFITYPAASGVSDQPVGITETKQGAVHRAKVCKSALPEAEFWLGLEGGLEIIDGTYFVSAWMCVLGTNDKEGFGRTGAFPLPHEITELITEGMELGKACDTIFSKSGTGQRGGAVAILTDEKITRSDFYVPAIMFALIPFSKPALYR